MSKKTLIPVILLSAVGLVQLRAQDFNKFAFNIGGGINTPINPTANYVGLGGNFAPAPAITRQEEHDFRRVPMERSAAQHRFSTCPTHRLAA